MKRKTLKQPISLSGVALHSGKDVCLTLNPSHGTGILFRRTDVDVFIPALYENVVDTRLCTVIENEGYKVSTIEHLMAALSSCGITDIIIEISSDEVPITDGSSMIFVELITTAGIKVLDGKQKQIKVLKPIVCSDNGWEISLLPNKKFSIDFEIDFKDEVIGKQRYVFKSDFKTNIAYARTFGLLADVNYLQENGLALGGSLNNAIVIGDGKVLNKGGLRLPKEFVKHKILDTIGDLALAGNPIIGKVVAKRSGHTANNMLLHALFFNKSNWCYK